MDPSFLPITAYHIARRFVGQRELGGQMDNPQIMAMLKLDAKWPDHDEVPWCSAFVNYVCWLINIKRSKSLRARSWLLEGIPVDNDEAQLGFDVVILKRGKGTQPGADVIAAPGHVGFFAGWQNETVRILGGNQGNEVNISTYAKNRILGIRRIYGG